MKRKRYSFTLMEVMVGLAILSIVLSVIFSSLYRETLLNAKLKKIQKIVMDRIEMQQSLDRVFANLAPAGKGSVHSVEGGEPILAVTFDNGVQPHPLFCGSLKGLICVEDGNLVLKLHPGKEWERSTILKENVHSLAFEFLTWESVGVQASHQWDKERATCPSFVKIILNREEEYVFWVNQKEREAISLRESR